MKYAVGVSGVAIVWWLGEGLGGVERLATTHAPIPLGAGQAG
jgi:hypothetical protein